MTRTFFASPAAFRAWLGRGRREAGVATTNAFAAWRAILTDAYATADTLEEREAGLVTK